MLHTVVLLADIPAPGFKFSGDIKAFQFDQCYVFWAKENFRDFELLGMIATVVLIKYLTFLIFRLNIRLLFYVFCVVSLFEDCSLSLSYNLKDLAILFHNTMIQGSPLKRS